MSLIDKEVITEIANQLSIPVSEIYKVYVVAQPTIGIIGLLGIILWLCITGGITYIAYKKISKDSCDRNISIVVVASFGGFLTFVLIAIIISSVTGILLPEYSAIQSLLGKL